MARKKRRAWPVTVQTTLITTVGLIIVGVISAVIGPMVLEGFKGWLAKPDCPYQGTSDPITLANLINAEAIAVNRGNYGTLQKIFDPNARILNRMNDKNASDINLEWNSPNAYYADTLFPSNTITSAVHYSLNMSNPGSNSAEAWATSGSRGYANGVKYDNLPPSDHWRFMKNPEGCWVIAEFEFNASHIPFP